jgi:hypothetical protein
VDSPVPGWARPGDWHAGDLGAVEAALTELEQEQVVGIIAASTARSPTGSRAKPSVSASGEKGSSTPIVTQARVAASSGVLGRLWKGRRCRSTPRRWFSPPPAQIGAELKDGLREAPGYIAFARENGTVYHTYTVTAPDPFVAPFFNFLLDRTPKPQPGEPLNYRKDEYPDWRGTRLPSLSRVRSLCRDLELDEPALGEQRREREVASDCHSNLRERPHWRTARGISRGMRAMPASCARENRVQSGTSAATAGSARDREKPAVVCA